MKTNTLFLAIALIFAAQPAQAVFHKCTVSIERKQGENMMSENPAVKAAIDKDPERKKLKEIVQKEQKRRDEMTGPGDFKWAVRQDMSRCGEAKNNERQELKDLRQMAKTGKPFSVSLQCYCTDDKKNQSKKYLDEDNKLAQQAAAIEASEPSPARAPAAAAAPAATPHRNCSSFMKILTWGGTWCQ